MTDPNDISTKDLFEEPARAPEHVVPPSEAVYADMGGPELFYIGEVQLPRPMPVELVIEVDGWDYYFKLDRREKANG